MTKILYCSNCGKKLSRSVNQTGYSIFNGKPLFALWLICSNKECSKVSNSAPEYELVKNEASEKEAERWMEGAKMIEYTNHEERVEKTRILNRNRNKQFVLVLFRLWIVVMIIAVLTQ